MPRVSCSEKKDEIAESKAAADKKIEEARGESESNLLIAKAEAEAIRIKGEALADNPKVLVFKAIETWDGKLPQYFSGGQSPTDIFNLTPKDGESQ